MAKLDLDPAVVPNCTLKDGILRYKIRIWIGSIPARQNQLIDAVHASALGGHSGFPVTSKRLKNMFYWKGMKAYVQNFVKGCQVCLQANRIGPVIQVNFSPSLFHLKHGRPFP
jgi:hypothetical protein